jgi:hypothetical protein
VPVLGALGDRQWRITHHSGDVVRGTDLADQLRFDADDVPPFFPAPSEG